MKQFFTRALPLFGVAVIMTAFAACDGILGSDDGGLAALLRANEQKWLASGPPQAYTLDVVVVSAADTTGAVVRIEVRNGDIAAAHYVDEGEIGDAVPASQWDRYPTVEGLFDIVRDAIGRRVSGMAVSYHTQYGYPDELAIDYDYRRVDDDLIILADNLVVLP